MTTHHKDVRLVDDPDQSGELRSLLRAGIDDEVTAYDFEAGLAKHMATVAALPPAVSAPHVPVAAAGGMSGKALLAWIGVPVASVSVIAAIWLGSSAAPAPELARTTSPVPPTVTHAPAPTVTIEPAPPALSVTPTIEHVAAPASVRKERPAHAQRNAAAVTDQRDSIAPTVTAAQPATTTTTTDEIATSPTLPVDHSVSEAQAPEPAPTAAEQEALARKAAEQAEQDRAAREEARRVAEERLKREMAQLMQATQALTSNPARALSLAQAGEQEFRNSLFSEERQHVLLLALIKLGRLDEAERRAEPYLRAHPDSPFARRVRNALQDAK